MKRISWFVIILFLGLVVWIGINLEKIVNNKSVGIDKSSMTSESSDSKEVSNSSNSSNNPDVHLVSSSTNQESNTAGSQSNTAIISPVDNTLINNRANFPAKGFIKNYKKQKKHGYHFWMALSYPGPDGEPDNMWPKVYLKKSPFTVDIYDGGQNPFPEPQRVQLLLLKMDEAKNQKYTKWLKDGLNTGVYIPIKVDKSEVVSRVDLLFP